MAARKKHHRRGIREQRGGVYSKRIIAIAERQAELETIRGRQRLADLARDKFRPRKADRGRIVFVGVKGQRDARAKGRKGYPVYVSKTGRKQLVYLRDRSTGRRVVPRPRKLASVKLPLAGRLSKKAAAFQGERRIFVTAVAKPLKPGQLPKPPKKVPLIKRSGGARARHARGLRFAAGSRAVEKMARDIRGAIEGQAGHRQFLIRVEVLLRLPDGSTERVEVFVDIAKADHIAIAKGGIRNFVLQKFYYAFARALEAHGLVTRGSANHIRRLKVNQGREEDEDLLTASGQPWTGNDLQVCDILSMHWEVEQLKLK